MGYLGCCGGSYHMVHTRVSHDNNQNTDLITDPCHWMKFHQIDIPCRVLSTLQHIKFSFIFEKSHKSDFLSEKTYFLSSVRNMFWVTIYSKYHACTGALFCRFNYARDCIWLLYISNAIYIQMCSFWLNAWRTSTMKWYISYYAFIHDGGNLALR